MSINDTHWKCFMMDLTSNQVYGMIMENEKGIGYDHLGNKGNGKFYSMGTHYEGKHLFKNRMFEITFDYNEAYSHLTK